MYKRFIKTKESPVYYKSEDQLRIELDKLRADFEKDSSSIQLNDIYTYFYWCRVLGDSKEDLIKEVRSITEITLRRELNKQFPPSRFDAIDFFGFDENYLEVVRDRYDYLYFERWKEVFDSTIDHVKRRNFDERFSELIAAIKNYSKDEELQELYKEKLPLIFTPNLLPIGETDRNHMQSLKRIWEICCEIIPDNVVEMRDLVSKKYSDNRLLLHRIRSVDKPQ